MQIQSDAKLCSFLNESFGLINVLGPLMTSKSVFNFERLVTFGAGEGFEFSISAVRSMGFRNVTIVGS